MNFNAIAVVWTTFLILVGSAYLFFRFVSKYFPLFETLNEIILAFLGAIAAFPAILIGGLLIFSFLNLFPKYTFYDTFAFAAPDDVRELKGGKNLLGDGSVRLEFRASKKTLTKITGEDYDLIDKREFHSKDLNFNRFVENTDVRIYEDDRINGKFGAGKKWLAYNETDGEIFYYQMRLDTSN